MKKLTTPSFAPAILKQMRNKVDCAATAQVHWKRNYGVYARFKKYVTASMKIEQSNRCAYCGTRLHEKRPHRDHIAPKGLYFQWTFWPINIVLACYCCNVDCKGETDTVDTLAPSYRRTTFKIVHPFLDDPADHLEFVPNDNSILITPVNGSAKGEETIRLFNLMDPERAKERAKDALIDDDIAHLNGISKDLMVAAITELATTPLRLNS